jgi:hypothetical protein
MPLSPCSSCVCQCGYTRSESMRKQMKSLTRANPRSDAASVVLYDADVQPRNCRLDSNLATSCSSCQYNMDVEDGSLRLLDHLPQECIKVQYMRAVVQHDRMEERSAAA